MKAECSVERLKLIIPALDRIAGKNLSLPILSSILIIANGKSIKFRATNLDVGIEAEIQAKIEKEGIVAVKSSLLNNLFNSLSKEKNASLESSNDNLIINTTDNKTTIKCLPYNDFPTIPLISGGTSFSIDPQKFLQGAKSVVYSAALSDIKPEIASLYIYPDEDDLVFVSTDSFRLAEKRIKTKTPDFHGLIIPHKNILEIIKTLELAEKEVKISFTKNQISFSFDNIYITSRLIDGVFPDYKQIIPKEETTKTVILKQDLISALKINNIFVDKFNQITIGVSPKTKKMSIGAKSGDLGENKSALSAALSGAETEINLNHRYLFDVFQSINQDSVSMSFSGANKPVVVRGVSDKSFTYLIMPLNR